MTSDDKKNWGTIFLDANRESNLSKLDAMQAASRQEQFNQRSQQDYLEKVRQKAIDRAREILGEAYTERQSVLEEAERDAERIRAEVKATYAAAEETRSAAQDLRHHAQAELDNATHIRNAAHEEGFQAGLTQAQEELDNFRTAMGSSVAGVLHVIEGQCMQIFAQWRAELVDIVRVSVKHATHLALTERHEKIIESMLLEAIQHLDDKRSITLRVHPEDEPVVADLFTAAKEKNPDLGLWKVSPDPTLNPGDIVAESLTGSVHSRMANYAEMVENIIQHLALPETQVDAEALEQVHNTVEEEIQHVQALIPAEPELPPVEQEHMPAELEPAPAFEAAAASSQDHLDAQDYTEALNAAQALAQNDADLSVMAGVAMARPHTPLSSDHMLLPQSEGAAPASSGLTPGMATAEERAALQNLFADEPSFDDELEENERLAQHMSPEQVVNEAAEQAPQGAGNQETDPNASLEDFAVYPEEANQAPAAIAAPEQATQHIDPTMQELEDELLGDDFLSAPVPGPRDADEQYNFDDDHIIKGKA